uniref:Uncharacterized protein n=1 Tax=Strigamia maritima TaxID=126957 RepID=T1JC69_STRMM
MAEQQMEAKSKPVSPDDINNLSDNDYQKLLDEALNIKSVSPHDKSPMMRHLLKAVAIDDDDLASNVREMMDAMKESGATSTKKPRRRAKDDQQRASNASVASRSIQGGSLQNLTGCDVRKSDASAAGEGRGRGRLHKSGSVNSFISATDEKLFSSARLKTRSRSHTLSGDLSDSDGTRKCGCSGETRCCPKQTRRMSTSVCGEAEKCVVKNAPPGEEIEMMEIGVSDEEVNSCASLLKSAARAEAQVDDSICLPLQVDVGLRNCDEEKLGESMAGREDAHKDGIYENGVKGSAQALNKKKKNGKSTELVISNDFLSDKINILRPQLDVNGNPLTEHLRNMTLTSFPRNYTNLEPNCDLSESSSELEKRRKHKRNKPSNTLKEMKAGDIQGNRGDDPLESLVEFINSSDKKTIGVKQAETVTKATATSLGLKNNKVQQSVKAKKQEKENNKKNMPSRILVDDPTTQEFCENDVNGSIFDLLDLETSRNMDLDSPIDMSEHVNGTMKIQTVRKAHSWEGSTLPQKVVAINCDLMEVSSDGGVVFVPQGGNNTCEPAVISSFVTDFYEESDVAQLVEEPEFRIVIPKRYRRNNRYVPRGGDGKHDFERANRHFDPYSGGVNGEDMMLLARLPISHRTQRGVCESRRKSTSSMPPSEHSSVDNSDLDSVHSLPVKSTTTKQAVAKTSSSSSSTPQASYADIAKMAANSATNLMMKPQLSEEMTSLPQRGMMPFLRPIKKKDASTCTTDDIPGAKKPQITHWASYPILNEATGKNDTAPTNVVTGNGGNGDSGCPSDESKRDDSNNTTKSAFSSPESVDGSSVPSSASSMEPKSQSFASGCENLPPSCGVLEVVGDVGDRKKEEEEEKKMVAVTMPAKPGVKKRKEAVCSPATTNSSSSDGSEARSASSKGRKVAARNTPAVVIMNKLKGGSYSFDVSFGFEVNEQLLGKGGLESAATVEDVKCGEGSVSSQEVVGVSCEAAAVVEVSSPSSCSSDSNSKARSAGAGPVEDGGFNYSNVVDFINQSWSSVVKEYEKEKLGAGCRHVKYLNDK